MNRYVKKPIAIEAVKWKGFNNDEIKDFAGDSVKIEVIREGDADNGIPPSVDCSIETLEGVMRTGIGSCLISLNLIRHGNGMDIRLKRSLIE